MDEKGADYWIALDILVEYSDVVIDRPKGSRHPRYLETIYPLDYGYLKGTVRSDGQGIDVWLGSSGKKSVTGVVLTVDLHKRDAEQKILCGCSIDEAEMIREFHNQNSQQAVLMWRKDW